MEKREIIQGQVVAKANNYELVPDGAGGHRMIKSEQVREYERTFIEQCKVYKDKLIATPFNLDIDVYMSSWKFDLDNSLKTVLDCLQYCHAITDDNMCKHITATKYVDRYNPRIEFTITEINEQKKLFEQWK